MSGSDWLVRGPILALALALCLPAVPVIGTLLDNPNKLQGSDYRDYHARCADCLAFASGELDGQANGQQRYCQPEQPNWCDLAAQYRSAAATESSRYAAWLAFFAALYGVFLLKETLREAAKTTRVAQKVGEQAEKALILVKEIKISDLEIEEESSKRILFSSKWDFFGKIPAFDIVVFGKLSLRIHGEGDFDYNLSRTRIPYVAPAGDGDKRKANSIGLSFPVPAQHKAAVRSEDEVILVTLDVEIVYDDIFTVGTDRTKNRVVQSFEGVCPKLGVLSESMYSAHVDQVERDYQPYTPVEIIVAKPVERPWSEVF